MPRRRLLTAARVPSTVGRGPSTLASNAAPRRSSMPVNKAASATGSGQGHGAQRHPAWRPALPIPTHRAQTWSWYRSSSERSPPTGCDSARRRRPTAVAGHARSTREKQAGGGGQQRKVQKKPFAHGGAADVGCLHERVLPHGRDQRARGVPRLAPGGLRRERTPRPAATVLF